MNPLLKAEIRDRHTGEVDEVMYGRKVELGSLHTTPMTLISTTDGGGRELYDFTKAQEVLVTHAEEEEHK